ncbi:receptor like protein 27, partial [Quercus suber]
MFSKLKNLQIVDLSHNPLLSVNTFNNTNFHGKNWEILDLYFNSLQGPLLVPPISISFLSISRNNLSGMIPSLICNISSLKVLDLSHNNLSDMISSCLGNFSDSLS